ncbi:MAG: aspartate-semialdehyde dehydrogenase [Candidatus Altiarchaeota archaeon]
MKRLRVGVLGATGMVGQNYIRLLEAHPWFEVAFVAASERSAGKRYAESVGGRWQMATPIPKSVGDLMVEDASKVDKAEGVCDFVFSAVEMDKKAVQALEMDYATHGIPVFSNSSAHRWTEDVPMLIPEVNPGHLDILPAQRKHYGWKRGFIVVKPNCSLQSYITPVHAIMEAGFEVKRMILSTLQAVSGAGYPGVASLDIVDNIIPYIGGEEEKSEKEPLKIFGKIEGDKIVNDTSMKVSAHCNRVPVVDGHTACVSIEFGQKKPGVEEAIGIWKGFRALPQELDLPSAPKQPIIYVTEQNRPQPRKDRDADKAMAVTVGRVRPCNVFDMRFVGLSHNTVRGAAGGGILNAELAYKKKLI